jgi:hypothetical protein
MVFIPGKFKRGSIVRIADLSVLEEFLQSWQLHHKLEPMQLEYAGANGEIENAYMYHGGDMIYKLKDIPGLWHERLLEA